MANKKQTSNKTKVGAAVAIGAGVAALGALGYLFLGPDGKKNRKQVKGWMLKMKGDVLDKIEKSKEVSGPVYEKIVDEIGAKYKKLKDIDPTELAGEIETLKKSWKKLTEVKSSKKTTKKAPAKRPTKKTA